MKALTMATNATSVPETWKRPGAALALPVGFKLVSEEPLAAAVPVRLGTLAVAKVGLAVMLMVVGLQGDR